MRTYTQKSYLSAVGNYITRKEMIRINKLPPEQKVEATFAITSRFGYQIFHDEGYAGSYLSSAQALSWSFGRGPVAQHLHLQAKKALLDMTLYELCQLVYRYAQEPKLGACKAWKYLNEHYGATPAPQPIKQAPVRDLGERGVLNGTNRGFQLLR